MIVSIRGILRKSSVLSAHVETAGLCYEVGIPVTTAEKLPNLNEEVFLHTYVVYKEDSQNMYGFATASERDFFKLLVEKVSGVGAKTAINILSRMSVPTLQNAINSGDVSLISKCPGIGAKTAQRLIIELRGVLSKDELMSPISGGDASQSSSPSEFADAVAALVALGYKLTDADKAVRKATEKLTEPASTEQLVKLALKNT